MFSIALIGGDGAGKTTIARMLERSYPSPIKYLYMGINIESSNIALPTSRLVTFLKNGKKNTKTPHSLHNQTDRKPKPKSFIWITARLANRLAEEWYRLMVSRRYQRNGYIVVYDRHFLFDFPINRSATKSELPFMERIHRWVLSRFYPRPDLTIFLDAPAEILFKRKGEATIAYLKNRQLEILKNGENTPNFFRIDSTQPVEDVYNEVNQYVSKMDNRIRNNDPWNQDRIEANVN